MKLNKDQYFLLSGVIALIAGILLIRYWLKLKNQWEYNELDTEEEEEPEEEPEEEQIKPGNEKEQGAGTN